LILDSSGVGRIVAAKFNLAGLRQAESVLRKDVEIMFDIADGKGVSASPAPADLARSSLDQLSRRPKPSVG
jgi:hypothetical protein